MPPGWGGYWCGGVIFRNIVVDVLLFFVGSQPVCGGASYVWREDSRCVVAGVVSL